MATRFLLLLALGALSQALASDVTPVEKVIMMLQNLQSQCVNESLAENVSYASYSQWCSATNTDKSQAIADNNALADSLVATIKSTQASLDAANTDIAARKATDQQLNADKTQNTKDCTAAKIQYDTTNADLSGALIGLQGAIDKLSQAAAKAPVQPSFLQIGFNYNNVESSLALAEALGFVESSERVKMTNFLQSPWNNDEGKEYNKADYAFQSGGIVATLNKLKDDFTLQSQTANANRANKSALCAATDAQKASEIDTNKQGLAASTQSAADLKSQLASLDQNLLQTRQTIKDDTKYLAEVMEDCRLRRLDFQQRSAARAGEIQALAQATSILQNRVKAKDVKVNGRAPMPAPSFLQLNLLSRGSLRRKALAGDDSALQEAAVRQLTEAGSRLHSNRISLLAERISMTDSPLKGVKDLVQGLINSLLKEAEAEASKKGFCDDALATAKKERDRRSTKSKKTSAELAQLDAKRTELLESLDLLRDGIAKLQAALAEATKLRAQESAQNNQTINDAKEGAAAVKEAMVGLKAYYDAVAKNASKHNDPKYNPDIVKKNITLVQVDATPDQQAGFKGSYGAKQGAATGILDMMEVILSDFEKTTKTTLKTEEKAAAEFAKFKSASNEDIKSKMITKTLDEEDLASVNQMLTQNKGDLTKQVQLLDGALKQLEELKPQCVDTAQSYEERKAKRDQEIGALTTAMCSLDPLSVESACKK